jgi:hypothetical protein
MRHLLLVLLASFAIAAPAPAAAYETPIDGAGAAYEAVIRSGFPFDEAVSDPDFNVAYSRSAERLIPPTRRDLDGDGDWWVSYTMFWQDCSGDCTSRSHTFFFTVDYFGGQVTYMGDAGDPLPPSAPSSIAAWVTGLPAPVKPVRELDASHIPWLAGFAIAILYVIFLALRPLLPSRFVPSRRAVRRRQEWGRRLRLLLALSPILLVAVLVVSMGLQLWELTGVVVALMAVFGVVLVAMLLSLIWRAAGR